MELGTGGRDQFELTKNARTNFLMLEIFYLTHLSPQILDITRQPRTKRVLKPESSFIGVHSMFETHRSDIGRYTFGDVCALFCGINSPLISIRFRLSKF